MISENIGTVILFLNFLLSLCSYFIVVRFSKYVEEATFTFWSQLEIRLIHIKSLLNSDKSLINNLYFPDLTKDWNSHSPSDKLIADLYEIIIECRSYIESAHNQVPAYNGFSSDMKIIYGFLIDCCVYDIRDNGSKFIPKDDVTEDDRDRLRQSVCDTIDRIVTGIDQEQKSVEKKLYLLKKTRNR